MASVVKPPNRAQLTKIANGDQQSIIALEQLFGLTGLPTGAVIYSAAVSVPGALPAIGGTQKRTDYPNLFRALGWASAVTITLASPGVVSWTGSVPPADSPVFFTGSNLPSPLIAGTEYFVKTPGTASFTISATSGGAAIDTTTAGSGNATAYPFGVGDGSTTFGIPDVSAVDPGVNAFVIY